MCCYSVLTAKWLKTQSAGSAGQKTTTSIQTQIIKSLFVQRLKNNELEEQCIHHINLIKYLGPSPCDYVNIMDHFGKLVGLITNISMAALAETCRLADTTQRRRIYSKSVLNSIQYSRKVVA